MYTNDSYEKREDPNGIDVESSSEIHVENENHDDEDI